jgi:hypothetical protein
MAALLERQENIAAHDNGDMTDDTAKIPQLGLSHKVRQVLRPNQVEAKGVALLQRVSGDRSLKEAAL